MTTEELFKERTELFEALYSDKVPKRVPISTQIPVDFSVPYSGGDLVSAQWNLEELRPAFDKVCRDFPDDTTPNSAFRLPLHYTILGSKGIVMSSSGFMQHPEINSMEPDEYDEYTADPYKFICETILPRLYTELDTDPVNKALVLSKAYKAWSDSMTKVAGINSEMNQKYGHWTAPAGSCCFTEAPMDFLADFLRSFTGITKDVRRVPQKLEEACDATLPLMLKLGTPKNPSYLGRTHMPLHMAPFMREKDFERLWWPSFKKLCDKIAAQGQPLSFFCEHDFTRYLDYLQELPENTRLLVEYGDPALFKEKVGQKHILSGFYPVTYLQTKTAQECVDKAKEMIDILAPGGKYWFNFDKSVNTVGENGVVGRNLKAVLEFVVEYGVYK